MTNKAMHTKTFILSLAIALMTQNPAVAADCHAEVEGQAFLLNPTVFKARFSVRHNGYWESDDSREARIFISYRIHFTSVDSKGATESRYQDYNIRGYVDSSGELVADGTITRPFGRNIKELQFVEVLDVSCTIGL